MNFYLMLHTFKIQTIHFLVFGLIIFFSSWQDLELNLCFSMQKYNNVIFSLLPCKIYNINFHVFKFYWGITAILLTSPSSESPWPLRSILTYISQTCKMLFFLRRFKFQIIIYNIRCRKQRGWALKYRNIKKIYFFLPGSPFWPKIYQNVIYFNVLCLYDKPFDSMIIYILKAVIRTSTTKQHAQLKRVLYFMDILCYIDYNLIDKYCTWQDQCFGKIYISFYNPFTSADIVQNIKKTIWNNTFVDCCYRL